MRNMNVPAPVAAPVAPVAAANAVPGYTVARHKQALTSLKHALHNLGRARDNLTTTARSARAVHPALNINFLKQGTAQHHRTAPDRIDRMATHVYNKLKAAKNPGSHNDRPIDLIEELTNAHRAIPAAIDGVRRAHDDLLSQHPALAGKSGKSGAKTRTFINDDGHHFSLGNYHGKKHTDPGDGVTIVKGLALKNYGSGAPHNRLFGGRKTRKHRRKHKRRKHKRKTRKHKRKRKTKKRKHHRRKHKRKTRRR